jgi:sortase (surface protein transpeptidase)
VGIQAVRARRNGIEVPPAGWAGWYSGGARPGEPGRAVVIGHFDTEDGAGVFERVPALDGNARIDVTDNRGAVHRYRVVGVTRVRKNRFPTQAVYGPSTNPVLVLVTCGGPFREGRGYRDNVLVYARSA